MKKVRLIIINAILVKEFYNCVIYAQIFVPLFSSGLLAPIPHFGLQNNQLQVNHNWVFSKIGKTIKVFLKTFSQTNVGVKLG